MRRALQITFRGMEPSEALSERIRDQVDRLEQVFDGVVGCKVVVEEPHRHHRTGRQFHVRVDLSVPGQNLVVSNDPGEAEGHEDAYVAVSDAFDAAHRQLVTYADHRRRHR